MKNLFNLFIVFALFASSAWAAKPAIVTLDETGNKITIDCRTSRLNCELWFSAIILDLSCQMIAHFDVQNDVMEIEAFSNSIHEVHVDEKKTSNIGFYVNAIVAIASENGVRFPVEVRNYRDKRRTKINLDHVSHP